MKDIDFDELDRAVNSVINPATKSQGAQTSSAPTHQEPASASPWEGFRTAPVAQVGNQDSSDDSVANEPAAKDGDDQLATQAPAQSDDNNQESSEQPEPDDQVQQSAPEQEGSSSDVYQNTESTDSAPDSEATSIKQATSLGVNIQPTVDAPQVIAKTDIAQEVAAIEENVVVDEVSAPEPESVPAPAVVSVTPTARRRSGLFMDVVHPGNSETDKEPVVNARSARAGRSFDFSAPQRSNVDGFQAPTAGATTAPTTQVSQSLQPSEERAQPTGERDSGAKDFFAQHDEIAWLDSAAHQANSNSDSQDQQPNNTSATPAMPAASLFSPDAKVEKRPLGAFNDAPAADSDDEKEQNQTPEATGSREASQGDDNNNSGQTDDAQKDEGTDVAPKDSQPAKEVLPPELQGDIVSVESDEGNDERDNANDKASAKVEPKPKSVQSNVMSTPLAAVSIPKQYQQATSKTSDNPQPVFDIKEYHPPIAISANSSSADPQHHRLALWVIIAIILLIATITGFGYWFYTSL